MKSEVNRLLDCNEEILRLTDWHLRYSLEEELKMTIEFLKEKLDRYKVGTYSI